jgi:hypothetical protein
VKKTSDEFADLIWMSARDKRSAQQHLRKIDRLSGHIVELVGAWIRLSVLTAQLPNRK